MVLVKLKRENCKTNNLREGTRSRSGLPRGYLQTRPSWSPTARPAQANHSARRLPHVQCPSCSWPAGIRGCLQNLTCCNWEKKKKKNPLAVFPALPFHFGFKENSGSKAQPQKGVNHYKNTKWRFGVNSVRPGACLSLKLAQPDSTSTEQLTASSELARPRKEVRLGIKAGTFRFQMAVSYWHRSKEITT